jgi:hypothetical protein
MTMQFVNGCRNKAVLKPMGSTTFRLLTRKTSNCEVGQKYELVPKDSRV